MSEKEKIYDETIAPLLLEVRDKCMAAGIPFQAAAWYGYEDEEQALGSTAFIPVTNHAGIRTVQAAIRANGNADTLITAMVRHGKEHGHTSAYLTILEMKS